MKDIHMIVADNIKDNRKIKKITQEELAERTGLSVDTIKRVEAAKPTSVDTLGRIAGALGIKPAYMLYGDENRTSYQERFEVLTSGRGSKEMEYVLFMVKKLLEGKDRYEP